MGRKSYTTEKLIELSRKSHGEQYDYSKSIYVDMHTPIVVICKIHGNFNILPYLHINRKSGCYECSLVKSAKSRSLGFNEFVVRSNKVHHDRYKYVKSSYIDTQHKVFIVCPIHGKFSQRVSSHLSGVGCKKCTFNK